MTHLDPTNKYIVPGIRTFIVQADDQKTGESVLRFVRTHMDEWRGFEGFDPDDYSSFDLFEIPLRVIG